MTELRNRRHEAFARDVGLFGVEPLEAFVRQGYKLNAGNATRLLHAPDVRARIQSLSAVAMVKAAEIAGVDRARALAEQAVLAYSNILDFVELKDGKAVVKNIAEIPREKAAAIASIGYDSNGNIKIRMHDKVAALANLLKYTEATPQPAKQTEGKPDAPAPTANNDWDDLIAPTEKPASALPN